jgi:anti-sigma factor RsiW
MSQLESRPLRTDSSLHLTGDQFTDCAIGLEPDAAVAQHLAQCELCRAELAVFGSSVDSFNRAAQSWSESLPAPTVAAAGRRPPAAWVPRPFLATVSWALAASMLLFTAISTAIHHHLDHLSPPVASTLEEQEDSPAQIEQDNKLLMAIEREIRVDDRTAVQEYGIRAASRPRGKPRGETTNQ